MTTVTPPAPISTRVGTVPAFRIYGGYGTDCAYIATWVDGKPVFFRHIRGGPDIANVCSRCGRDLQWGYTVVGPPCGCTVKRGCAQCLIELWDTAPEDNARPTPAPPAFPPPVFTPKKTEKRGR